VLSNSRTTETIAGAKMIEAYRNWEKDYVTADGEYGVGVITFDSADLTDKQYDLFTELHDSQRLDYVLSILNGNKEETARIETEYLGQNLPNEQYFVLTELDSDKRLDYLLSIQNGDKKRTARIEAEHFGLDIDGEQE